MLCPLLYMGWVALTMCAVDVTVASLLETTPSNRSTPLLSNVSIITVPMHDTLNMSAILGVLFFYRLQAIMALLGVVLVALNRALCHPFDTIVDFLAGIPLMFLGGLIGFTPWIPAILKSWGAILPWASVHLNSLKSIAPSKAENIVIQDGACLFSPILDPGKLKDDGGIYFGKQVFVGLGSQIDRGARLGNGVVVDTLAHIHAEEISPTMRTRAQWALSPVGARTRRGA